MSGSAGGNRIPKEVVEKTVQDYIDKVLSKFPGFKKAKVTGSYNAGTKQDFGDIDLIVQLDGTDKKIIKQDLAKYFATLPDSVIVPFKSDKYKGKKSLSSGELVTILYPIVGIPDQFVQIDNIVSISEEESTFKNTFLDYSAEVQGLLLGLAKVICLEEDPKSIFKRLGITNVPELEPNQEYEFNLSGVGLTLRIVTLDNFKEIDRTDVWKSSDWNTVKKLFANYNIDTDFKTLLKELASTLKNPRSKNRIKGIFKSMVSIKSGEVGTPKGDNKQIALNSVDSMLENMLFKGLVRELISDFIVEEITKESIALYPGKFKPPHKGHFDVAKQLLKKVNRVEIIISSKPVDGITAEQSKKVWELYNTLLGGKLDIKIIQGSPVTYVLDTIEANQNNYYVAVYGKGEEDRYRNVGKDPRYMNAETFDGGTTTSDGGNINATDFRNALRSGQDITKFIPDGLDKQDVFNALGIDGIAEGCGCQHEQPMDFKSALVSLTKYMINNGMNIKPLPKLIIIKNDLENANNVLGKTAHYDPNNCSITLFTLNRHPKDILRSYAHEMIHRIQDNEGRLNNIKTTNTNEDGNLEELEKEAYLNGNMTFRNWEDSLKKNINEWIVDTPKYNYTPKLSNKIFSQLHELKVNEITLNPNNAVEIYGDLDNGDFTVGEYDYNYRIIKLDKNPYNSNSFYSIDFHEIGNKNPNPSLPTRNAKENYIKILSTIYKIILDFTKEIKPEYIGISSLDESGYWNVYNNLTKTNQLPDYSRKDAGLDFTSKSGEKGKFIVLKRKQYEI
jgi:cytidyltransferase-like protein